MQSLLSLVFLFCNEFSNFKNTESRMLYFIFHFVNLKFIIETDEQNICSKNCEKMCSYFEQLNYLLQVVQKSCLVETVHFSTHSI